MNNHPIRRSRLCIALATALLFSGAAMAQSTSATLGGTITDAQGQAATNADVTITHVASGTVSQVSTDAAGRYNITAVDEVSGRGMYLVVTAQRVAASEG